MLVVWAWLECGLSYVCNECTSPRSRLVHMAVPYWSVVASSLYTMDLPWSLATSGAPPAPTQLAATSPAPLTSIYISCFFGVHAINYTYVYICKYHVFPPSTRTEVADIVCCIQFVTCAICSSDLLSSWHACTQQQMGSTPHILALH